MDQPPVPRRLGQRDAHLFPSLCAAEAALSLSPSSPLYTPYNVGLIFMFNYFYTFLQFEPTEVADNLKKGGASIPAIRPGRATAEYLEG